MRIYLSWGSISAPATVSTADRKRLWRSGNWRVMGTWRGWLGLACIAGGIFGASAISDAVSFHSRLNQSLFLLAGILVGCFLNAQIVGPWIDRYAQEILSRQDSVKRG